MMKIKNLSVVNRLSAISFECYPGEILHIIGPNGSGKSTLLAAVAGVLPYQGNVLLNGQEVRGFPVDRLSQSRAYLEQSNKLAFNFNVFQLLNLHINQQYRSREQKEISILMDVVKRMDLESILESSIHKLSGGEWQRVRLASVFLQIWPEFSLDKGWLLLDEPTSGLDIGHQSLLYSELNYLAKLGVGIIITTHDLQRAYANGDKVLLLNNGKAQGFGCPDKVMTSELLSHIYKTNVLALKKEKQVQLLL